MGVLVRFVKPDRPISVQPDEKREAEIIMFTGVRYERDKLSASRKRNAAKRKQKIR